MVCRVGAGSLHRSWMGDPATRSYDVWLDHWGEAGNLSGEPAVVSEGRNTTKWPRMATLLSERPEAVTGYHAVWFPDDDLKIDAAGVERLFAWFHGLELWLAQPALTPDSYFSHHLTVESRAFALRYTNFVEVMAPLFSSRALHTCAGVFADSTSGWGLDAVFSRLLGDPVRRIGILDAVPVTHTRPIGGGSFYGGLKVEPIRELEALSARFGVPVPFPMRYHGGLAAAPSPAEALRRPVPLGIPFLGRLLRGAPPGIRRHSTYWKVQLQAMRRG